MVTISPDSKFNFFSSFFFLPEIQTNRFPSPKLVKYVKQIFKLNLFVSFIYYFHYCSVVWSCDPITVGRPWGLPPNRGVRKELFFFFFFLLYLVISSHKLYYLCKLNMWLKHNQIYS